MSRTVFTWACGTSRSSRPISVTVSFTRPASPHSRRKKSRRLDAATMSALWADTRMSPSRSRSTPRPMRLPRMSRWVRLLSGPWKDARRNASSSSGGVSAQSGRNTRIFRSASS